MDNPEYVHDNGIKLSTYFAGKENAQLSCDLANNEVTGKYLPLIIMINFHCLQVIKRREQR